MTTIIIYLTLELSSKERLLAEDGPFATQEIVDFVDLDKFKNCDDNNVVYSAKDIKITLLPINIDQHNIGYKINEDKTIMTPIKKSIITYETESNYRKNVFKIEHLNKQPITAGVYKYNDDNTVSDCINQFPDGEFYIYVNDFVIDDPDYFIDVYMLNNNVIRVWLKNKYVENFKYSTKTGKLE